MILFGWYKEKSRIRTYYSLQDTQGFIQAKVFRYCGDLLYYWAINSEAFSEVKPGYGHGVGLNHTKKSIEKRLISLGHKIASPKFNVLK